MFNQEKATHLAYYLLNKSGGKMKYLKLIKLIYFIDRKSIEQTGFSVTTDRYVSMKHGPIASNVYSLINDEIQIQDEWHKYIKREEYDVCVISKLKKLNLSQKDLEIADEIYNKFGERDRWDLVKETHKYPDWKKNTEGMIPISKKEMMKDIGFSEEDINEIEEQETLNNLLCGKF